MARYDEIYGAGNVTVQAPPDFWTAAKQSFDKDYDRLVEIQQRKDAKEQQNIANNRAERQLKMQEEQAAMQKESEEREKYMTEISMIENPTLRAEYAARHGVSKGWTPNEQVEEWKEMGIDKSRYETIRSQYLRGDNETKSLLRNRMRDAALEANASATEFNTLEEIGNQAHNKQSMKVASDIALQFLPAAARTRISSMLTSGVQVDENVLNTVGTILESELKTAGTAAERKAEGKQKLHQGVITALGKVTDATPPSVVATLNDWDTKLKNDPDVYGYNREKPIVSGYNWDSMEEKYKSNLSGLNNSFNELSNEEKKAAFESSVSSVMGDRKFGEMSEEERTNVGLQIREKINETNYSIEPDIDPDNKQAGFLMSQKYGVSDDWGKKEASLLPKNIRDKYVAQFGKVINKSNPDAMKFLEDNKFFDMLSEMQNRKNLTFKQFKDYLNRSKFFDKLESELKKAKKIDMESVLKKKREQSRGRRKKKFQFTQPGVPDSWMEPATEPID